MCPGATPETVTTSCWFVALSLATIPGGNPVNVALTRAGISYPVAPLILKVIGVNEVTFATVDTHNSWLSVVAESEVNSIDAALDMVSVPDVVNGAQVRPGEVIV